MSAASALSTLALVVCGCAVRVVSTPPPDAATRDALETPCDGALVACGGSCVDPASGLISCGATCVDPRANAAHCGGCERRCVAGQTCIGGVCVGGETLAQRSCGAATPGCGMVPVEGAVFAMGDEAPEFAAAPVQTNVRVHGFAIDAYEVTVARFRAWMAAGQPIPSGPVVYRGGALPFEGPLGPERALACDGDAANYRAARDRENHPINCVNWAMAQAFCVWDGNGLGRLPTQAEWELAARGTTGRWYPWGSSAPDSTRACWSGMGAQRRTSCVVGSFPAGDSPGGVHDLAGNIWELVADAWEPYRNTPPGCWINSGPTDPICIDRSAMNGERVARGGWWGGEGVGSLGSAAQGAFWFEGRSSSVGFRCARDTP